MSDRIDEALKALAHAEAPRDFAVQVRARLEAGAGVRVAGWPRLAAACVVVLATAATLVWLRGTPTAPATQVAHTTAPGVVTPSTSPRPVVDPRGAEHDVTARRSAPGARPAPRARTQPAPTGDHERALAPLSPLDALALPSVAPDAMAIVDRVIAPLAPIAPLPVSELLADTERGEL